MSINARKYYPFIVLILMALPVSGCASLGKRDLNRIEKLTKPRTGLELTQFKKPEDPRIKQAVEPLLEGKLTLDSVLRIGLMNNPTLQAVYQELGIAKADLLQATLFENPRFEGHARVPEDGGKVNTELVFVQDFMSILLMPLRRRVASAEFEEARLRTSDAVISLVAEIKTAYYELLAKEQVREMRRTVLEASEAAVEIAERLYQAGNINAIEWGTQRSAHEQARIDFMQSEYEAKLAREPLNRLLGLRGEMAKRWSVRHFLPELLDSDPPLEYLEELALKERLDYQAVRQEIEVLRRSLLATRLGIIPQAEVGINTEVEPDGDRVTGPTWGAPIPVIDWKQAARARAKAELRAGQFKASAFEVQVLSEVRETQVKLIAHRKITERYRDEVIPVREALVKSLQQHYNFMLVGVFQLIEGKQEEIQARREYIEALKNYWTARTDLERAVGGKLPEIKMAPPKETLPTGSVRSNENLHRHHQGGDVQ